MLNVVFVYKSLQKEGIYLYIIEKDDFSKVPLSLLKLFSKKQFIFAIPCYNKKIIAGQTIKKFSKNAVNHRPMRAVI